jgi:hypothetical protein
MNKDVGLWIDHKHAVIVTISPTGEEVKCISSHLENETRPSGGWGPHGKRDYVTEDMHERRSLAQLERYYGEVIHTIGNAGSIQIFGPGLAKGELARRLENHHPHGRIIAIEPVERMTDRQIAARVRARINAH